MEIIKITWQSFINGDGEDTNRCNQTYLNLEKAIFKLEPVLLSLGVKLCFEKKRLPYSLIDKYPELNNTILIDDEPIEKFLKLKKNRYMESEACNGDCEFCNENDVEEVIPEYLIVMAILSKVKERTLKVFY